MTALADVVRDALNEMRCDCWYEGPAEFGPNHPCTYCRLREALKDEDASKGES